MPGFLKMMREPAYALLQEDPNAFLILTQAALRADRETGVARIGVSDFLPHMSRQAYRSALARLQSNHAGNHVTTMLATIQTTKAGTLVTFAGVGLYDINESSATMPTTDPATTEQPCQQPLTRSIKKKNKSKGSIPPPFADVEKYFKSKGESSGLATGFFDYYESNGWKVGGKAPMRKWTAAASNWIKRQENFNGTSNGRNPQSNRATARDLLTDTGWANPPDQPTVRDTVGDVSVVSASGPET